MSDCIQIALAADARFYPGLFMTACSLSYFLRKDCCVVFNVLDGGIGQEYRDDFIFNLRRINPNASVNWLDVDASRFDELPSWRNAGKMAWARLLLPQLLPDVDWILYLDTDFVCLDDVSVLWTRCSDACSLMGVKDTWSPVYPGERCVFSEAGLKFNPDTYICSGLCFFNLDRIRRLGLDKAWFDYARRGSKRAPLFDQTIINMTFSGRPDLLMLPSKWQTFTREMTYDDLIQRPVLHYAGDAPWVCFPVNHIFNDAAVLWFRVYAHLRGISYWGALRSFYSARQIIFYRLTYLLFSRIGVFRALLRVFFHLEGHDDSIVIYDALLHPVKLPPVSYFFNRRNT